MRPWLRLKTLLVDLAVSGGIAAFLWMWFADALGSNSGALLAGSVFGLFQLLRFINAQLVTLEWVKLNEAGLAPERPAANDGVPRGDGYRIGARIEEQPSPDEEQARREVAGRRRGAILKLSVVGGALGLGSLIPALMYEAWTAIGVVAFVVALTAAALMGTRARRRSEARRSDHFMQHLARDTRAVVEGKRVAVDEPHLRVGVDFGVPNDEEGLEAPEESRSATTKSG